METEQPELVLDPSNLSENDVIPDIQPTAPKELPKPLADFKHYADSKLCYFSKPLENAEMIDIQQKVAYRCQMTILMEARHLRMAVTPHTWNTERVLGSKSLGRLMEETQRTGEAVGNIWTDYEVEVPSRNDKSKRVLALVESASYSRCSRCRAKGRISCTNMDCGGSGKISGGTQRCSSCNGSGRVTCYDCDGLGGFQHMPTLRVQWFPRISTWFYQNSFLNEKKIAKGQLTLIWSAKEVWSKQTPIEYLVQTINEAVPEIPLRANIIKDYHEKHLAPTFTLENQMRRLECSVEQLNFEEVQYQMGENYVNKREPTKGNTFRFCQYPGSKGEMLIYENDYPLNCCGCCGEKLACYCGSCTIL